MATGLPSLAAFDWAALGAEASMIFRTAPGLSCMLGPLSAEVSSLHLFPVPTAVFQVPRFQSPAVRHPVVAETAFLQA
jgi:hypothetical protein